MVGPINYTGLQVQPELLKNFTSGFEVGAAIDARARQQAQLDSYNADLQSYMQQPSAQGASALALKYPTQGKAIRENWEAQDETTRKDQSSALSQIYAATLSDRPDIANGILERRIGAMEAAGADASTEKTLLQLSGSDPKQFAGSIGFILSHINDPKTFAASFGSLGKERRDQTLAPTDLRTAQAKAGEAESTATIKRAEAGVAPVVVQQGVRKGEAEISNVQSQIAERSARLGLDQDKLTSDVQMKVAEITRNASTLPGDASKNLNEAATQASASEQAATQALDLATKLDVAGGGYGGFSKASEFFKSVTGNQDAMTALRQEYTRVRSQGVMKMLPPGPATDKDVALAMEGFPAATADAKQLASFLRGMAKLQTYDAALNNAKAQWFGEVHNLGAAKRDLTIGGVQVPAGTSFNDFARQAVGKQAAQQTVTNQLQTWAQKYGGGAQAGY